MRRLAHSVCLKGSRESGFRSALRFRAEAQAGTIGGGRRVLLPGKDWGARQGEGEEGALAVRAFHPDAATVTLHDRACDGQTQAGAALLGGVGGVDLVKALEDCRELVLGDAPPV